MGSPIEEAGKHLSDSYDRNHGATSSLHSAASNSPELRRLAEAGTALEHARRQAKWKRKCKNLHSAAHAVRVAALDAHRAGIGWTEIGDVLGIERAVPPVSSIDVSATPPASPTSPDAEPGRHRTSAARQPATLAYPETWNIRLITESS
jgi:hypothetical protein